MKHKWEIHPLTDKDKKDDVVKKYICVNGDCKCEKTHFRYYGNRPRYTRGLIIYDSTPECYGPIPLDEQPID